MPFTGDIEVRVTLEEGRRFSGRFLDDAGQPVPDLTLTVFPRDARLFHGSRHRWRTVKTDGDGRFSVEGLLDDWYWIHLLDDAWVPRVSGVTGSIDNDARIEAWFFATRLDQNVERDFIVQRAAAVNASATEASGRPLAGAHVRLEVRESDPRKMVWGSFGGRFGDADLSHGFGAPCAVTKADGTCSIRGLPPFSETRFIVEHEDHAPVEFVLDLSHTRTDEPTKLEARLVDQAHARAIVTAAGEPLSGLRLRGGWPQFDSHVGLPWVTTNHEGIADLIRLPLGRVGIHIDLSTAPSGQMLVDTANLSFDATSTSRDIAIAFRAVVYVKGTIQREDGTPFQGSVAIDVDGRRRFGRAGSDGQVSIEVGRPGRFAIVELLVTEERVRLVRFVAKDPAEAYLDTSSPRTIVVIPAPK